jgi:hypothetical protein
LAPKPAGDLLPGVEVGITEASASGERELSCESAVASGCESACATASATASAAAAGAAAPPRRERAQACYVACGGERPRERLRSRDEHAQRGERARRGE